MQRQQFEKILTELLQPGRIKDFCPNGLQVEGSETIEKVVTGVTASYALLKRAIENNADAVLVHHGYFWKNEAYPIVGMKQKRIKALIDNNINLFAYHLPLDIHETLGNNAQLAKLLDIQVTGPLELDNPLSVSLTGELAQPVDGVAFASRIQQSLQREVLHIPGSSNRPIKTVAWCTGGGQGYIELAAEQGIDAFITGEASEQTTHVAREMDIHFFAAGHHATERYGIKAVGEYLAKEYGLDVEFIDIDNPV
ncbi:Nif3-like dinuclear metal center hexameric protein [Thalassotalea mangrovi]|uniref:GTP cyclohydrolase 1 type 2 homolog n=1 Tax=Thalassotalea mangrovi TaxID=2572245 RepID=A0A4U1B2M5_9GAMM|nr:Nif3-like dinuclear metal center hexameric protein [Thalassotalea mangrovi]TKB43368.1 Nif3-like dinuclear metal center hexameric protein [Thalassotalea mangrovi]